MIDKRTLDPLASGAEPQTTPSQTTSSGNLKAVNPATGKPTTAVGAADTGTPGTAGRETGGEKVSTRSREEIERDIQALRERSGTHSDTSPAEVRARARSGDDRISAEPTDERLRQEHVQEERVSEERRRAERHGYEARTISEDDDSGKSSAELEREVESERAEITSILDELRNRMSPGQIVDQALDYARESGGGDFARNLGRSVRDNPIPVLMVGAGIAWLTASGNREPHPDHDYRDSRDRHSDLESDGPGIRERASSATSRAKQGASELGSRISDAASRAAGAVSGAASAGRHAAGEARDSMTERASSTYDNAGAKVGEARERAGEYAGRASRTAHDARDSIYRGAESAQRGWARMAEEQPIVLGAIGLAIGAAIGAALPLSRTENRYMGQASDAVKDQVRSAAQREYEHAKDAAGKAYEDVKQDMDKRGFSARAAADAVSSAARKAGDAANRVAEDARSEVEKMDAGKSDMSKPDAKRRDGSGAGFGLGVSGFGPTNPGSSPFTGPAGEPTTATPDPNKPKS